MANHLHIKLLCFCLLLIVTSCAPNNKSRIINLKGFEVTTDSVDIFLQQRMDSLNIPGLSMAVINRGEVVYTQNMGYANIEGKQLVTEKTIFEAASMSKSVFAFFVMKFVEEGKLDLDKPLYKYLPYPDIAYDERYKKITARIILSHRSGLPNWRENEEDKKLKIKFDPGTDYEYSGEGYQYLAMVLKEIESTDWNGLEEIFQKKVAQPLGMNHTVFIPTSYTAQHKAEPYTNYQELIDWKNDYWYKKEKGQFVAPSSMTSEPIDFSKWMIAVMNKEQLSPDSYKEILKHHSLMSTTSKGINVYYALGFITADKEYSNTYFHGGSNAGFTCYYLLNTEKKWGFVVFTNSENGEKLGNEVWDYFEREKY